MPKPAAKSTIDPILFDLTRPPSINQSHLWADYIELRCLSSEDKIYSSGNNIDQHEMLGDIATDIDPLGDLNDDTAETISEEGVADLDLKIHTKWSDLSVIFDRRQHYLGDSWPFKRDGKVLVSEFNEDSSEHVLYVALLVASALRYCKKSRQAEVTSFLEELGYRVMRKLFPEGWEVHPFGAHQQVSNRYSGHLYKKYVQLANDIRAELRCTEDDFSANDTGDGGIDVVIWHPMEDARSNTPTILVQCGCTTDDWTSKSLESSMSAQAGKIRSQSGWAHYFVLPHDACGPSNKWERSKEITDAVYIDRLRLIKLVNRYSISLKAPDFIHSPEYAKEAAMMNLSTAA